MSVGKGEEGVPRYLCLCFDSKQLPRARKHKSGLKKKVCAEGMLWPGWLALLASNALRWLRAEGGVSIGRALHGSDLTETDAVEFLHAACGGFLSFTSLGPGESWSFKGGDPTRGKGRRGTNETRFDITHDKAFFSRYADLPSRQACPSSDGVGQRSGLSVAHVRWLRMGA